MGRRAVGKVWLLLDLRRYGKNTSIARGLLGLRGQEDGRGNYQVGSEHRYEDQEGTDNTAQRGSGAGPNVEIQSLSKFIRNRFDENKTETHTME